MGQRGVFMRLIDLTGTKFNFLTVLEKFDTTSAGARWLCLCDCGEKTVVNSLKLRKGFTKSCGCHRRSIKANKTHGMANKTKTYKTWKCMRHRCNNRNSTQYKWYGAKGITYDKAWDDFLVFLADMGERPDGKTLDRINPDLGYFKDNCRWATPKEQAETNRGLFKATAAAVPLDQITR